MKTSGIRIHLAGSAAHNARYAELAAAHRFVGELASRLIEHGAGLVVGFGDEPVGEEGLPCTFDWTVLDLIAGAPSPGPGWPLDQPGRFRAIGSQRALHRIPETRRPTWSDCLSRADFELELSPPGWRMGGVIRTAQALKGDVLVAIGGGAGVEQLAELYSYDGKSVIPVQSELGASSDDGNGGASYLHRLALGEPASFFELTDGTGSAAGRLTELRVEMGTDPVVVAEQVVSTIHDLRPPRAFYARLMDSASDEFPPVQEFFRQVVDPVLIEKGMTPYEVGRDRPNAAFINVEIFERLHRSRLVVADLTDVRPNCMMELGYALARRRRVIVSAKEGTIVPFDTDKLPIFFWNSEQSLESTKDELRTWVEKHMDLPPIVE